MITIQIDHQGAHHKSYHSRRLEDLVGTLRDVYNPLEIAQITLYGIPMTKRPLVSLLSALKIDEKGS